HSFTLLFMHSLIHSFTSLVHSPLKSTNFSKLTLAVPLHLIGLTAHIWERSVAKTPNITEEYSKLQKPSGRVLRLISPFLANSKRVARVSSLWVTRLVVRWHS